MGQPTAISLFAGCGGDTLGLKKAGFKVVGIVENWKPAIETHKKNFPDVKLIGEEFNSNIEKIPDEEFSKFKGKADLIFAGFPCQGFSHAGKKDPKDPRNKLFWEFVRATQLIRPKWVVGENVSGLTKRKTDDGKAYISDVIVSAFEKIGYKMARPRILSAEEYGVPQKRRRVFFVGNKEGKEFAFPKRKSVNKTMIRNAIKFSLEGAVPINPTDVKRGIKSFCESKDNNMPSGTPHPYLLMKLKEKRISFAKRDSPYHIEIADLDAPAKTIHCGYRFQPRIFVAMKNNRGYFVRMLNTLELAQIQGFPKNFKFSGKKDDIINQIGNAVPPPLAEAIALEIKRRL